MNRERIGQIDVETTSAGVFLQSATGDVVHIPTHHLLAIGTILQHEAINARLTIASDPFAEPRSSRRLNTDGDVLSDRGF